MYGYFNLKSEDFNLKEVRKAFPNPKDGSPIHISMAGITYPDPTYQIVRQNSFVSVIEYIVDGEGYVVVDGKPHHVKQDMIYFLPAGADHKYFADEENPYTKIFMNIDESPFVSQMVSSFGLSGKYFFDGKGLRELFEKILITIHSDMTDGEMQAVFHGILCEVCSRLQKAENMSAHSDEALKLKEYLDGATSRMVSGKELSQVIFRSTDYCLKLFVREFGITPYAYQLDRKMQLARSLLRSTPLSVFEIADMLGYSDPHYFSNIFKEKCGVRPLEYRNKNK